MTYELPMNVSARRPAHTRAIACCLLAVGVLLAAAEWAIPASPAWAHVRLLQTSPKSDTVITQPIQHVTLVFNETGLKPTFTTVVVRDAAGRNYADGSVTVEGTAVNQAVKPLPGGTIQVSWRTVSADGHPVEGRFVFTVAAEAADSEASKTTPAAIPSPPPGAVNNAQPASNDATSAPSHSRKWIIFLGAGVALLALAAVTLFWRRTPAKKT